MRRALFVTIGILFATLTALPILANLARASSLSTSSLIGFNLAASPSSTNLVVGTRTIVTIIVSSQGLNGPVNLVAAVSSSSGLTVTLSPSSVLVLPSGTANSTLNIDGTSAQAGTYNVQVMGSSSLAASQETTVVTSVTSSSSSPPVSPPSGSPPPPGTVPPSGPGSPGNSGPGNGGTSTTSSGQGPKTTISPKGGNSSPSSEPVAILIFGNLLAAATTAAAVGSLRKKKQSTLSRWQ